MSEINSEVVESVDEMVSVDEDRLVYRVDYIRENLLQLTTKLREKVPQNISDQDLIEDNSTTVILHETETLVIPAGTWHQLINPSRQELSIVEVQYGSECDEEDITRLYQ